MTSLLITICIWAGSVANLPCEFVEPRKAERKILNDYINDGSANCFFRDDMGVVHMVVRKDGLGRKTWNLQIHVDDRYKENPPHKWTNVGTYMILIWDENDTLKLDSLESQRRISCLSEIMGDRLYARVAPKTRYVAWPDIPTGKVEYEKDGRPKIRSVGKKQWLGRGYHDLIIIFNHDGSIEKQIRT